MEKIKAFVTALKEHLNQSRPGYVERNVFMETFGDTYTVSVDYFDTQAMMHEIDVFAESFKETSDDLL